MIAITPTVFPRSGTLPQMRLRALPASLAEAAAVAVAFADDVRRTDPIRPRRFVAEAAMHALVHALGSPLALVDVPAVWSGAQTAPDALDAALGTTNPPVSQAPTAAHRAGAFTCPETHQMPPVHLYLQGHRFTVLDADALLAAAASGASAHTVIRDGLGAGRFARLLNLDPSRDDLDTLRRIAWSEVSGTDLPETLLTSQLPGLIGFS